MKGISARLKVNNNFVESICIFLYNCRNKNILGILSVRDSDEHLG